MFPKHRSKNLHVRGAETLDVHRADAQIINKTFRQTKKKIYFWQAMRGLRAPNQSKKCWISAFAAPLTGAGTVAIGDISHFSATPGAGPVSVAGGAKLGRYGRVVGDLTNNGVAGRTSESWHLRHGVPAAPAVAPQHSGGSGASWGACWDVVRYTDENFSRQA
jgi:hypothetical protein